ncbi:J domain-containing protein required for chloroplast accumulation response 1-like isoform X2 [Wolffia australiana]
METLGRRQGQVFVRSVSGDLFSCDELRRRSSTDFSDVFGGPPKRYSHQKTPSTISSSGDDSELGGRSEKEEAVESYQRWPSSSSLEKPVFGGVGSPARRRHLGEDFFSDIFKGSESPSSTPKRKGERDRFGVNTGSSMLSPGRPLPPPASVLGGDSSAANLSYSSRLVKSFDNSPASSPIHTSEKAKESKGNTFILHPINSSSHSISKNDTQENNSTIKEKPAAMDNGIETSSAEEQMSKDSSGAYSLHFSMYKWANKGVTLVVPSNLKEKSKGRSRLGAVYAQVSQELPDLPLDKENLPKGVRGPQNPVQPEDKASKPLAENVKGSSPKIVPEILCDITDKSDEVGALREEGTGLKNLRHMLADDLEREEKEDMLRRTKEKDTATGDVKKSTRSTNNPAKPKQAARENSAMESHEKTKAGAPHLTRSSSRVKESVKIFESKEAVHKEIRKPRVEDRQSPKRVDEDEDRVNYRTSAVPVALEERQSTKRVNEDEDRVNYRTSTVPVPLATHNLKQERTQYDIPSIRKVDRSFSETSGLSRTLSDSTLSGLDATFCGIEVTSVDDIEDFLVVDISNDCNEVAEAKQREDEIQKSDAKIREWSRGREGNIRSLLSTLQNVLWPGSGWKPVRLVDIVEAPGVKRAYQRALLYLHPDKLQQKGAEAHQKYIAEKVFDILQEAWNHFNTLGSI